jgi:Protein of unknown function (DUF4019)
MLCIVALYSFAQEDGWRFPSDRITLAQWSMFRDEVLAKPGMERKESGNQLVITVSAESAIYVFTQPGHPAHPAVVVRKLVTVDGGTSINRMGHFAGNEQAFATWWKAFDSLDAAVKSEASAGPKVSVQQLPDKTFEITVTNPTRLSEPQAQAIVASAAVSVCRLSIPVLGKYRFDAKQPIGTGALSREAAAFRFIQQVSCAPAVKETRSPRGGLVLKSAAEGRAVEGGIRKLTEAHFRLLATGKFDAAVAQVDVAGLGGDAASWMKNEKSFQSVAGTPTSIEILKVTVYDNPEGAPKPGLYVAADFKNAYANVPFQCGYLMWFREPDGRFRITRQEKGHVTAEQLKAIPDGQHAEIKRRLRCELP